MEQWNEFINNYIKIVHDDPPRDTPRFKRGILKSIGETHITILRDDGKTESLRINTIRRLEVVE